MLSITSNDVSSTSDNSTLYYLVVIRIRGDPSELVGNSHRPKKTEEIRNYFRDLQWRDI